MDSSQTDDILNPSVQRALALLELLRARPAGVPLHELLSGLDISRSSLFALLNTLKQLGYVEQSERRGSYRAGPRLQAWYQPALLPRGDLLSFFYHEAAVAECGETLALAVPAADSVMILAQVESPQRVRSVFRTGEVYAVGQSAAYAVLHAASDDVIERGYAHRADTETVELALPICRDGVQPDAALLVSLPAFRADTPTIERLLLLLRESAARISYRLGAPAYTPFMRQPEADLPAVVPMDADQIEAFLRGPWTARLACLRTDQTPHVVPVWQAWDGQQFYIPAWRGSQWIEYVLAQPKVSLVVDEPWPPLRRVTARGTAYPLEPDEAARQRLLRSLRRRYLGALAWPPPDQTAIDIFRVVPDTLRGWQGIVAV